MPDIGLLWLSVIPGFLWFIATNANVPLLWVVGQLILLIAAYFALEHLFGLLELENLDKRAVFITGCDTGFGNMLALKCLGRRMPVFAGCLTEAGAESLRKQARSLPGKLETIIVDVTNEESVARASAYLEKASEKYGGLHGVVNNAGIVLPSFFDDLLSMNDYKRVAEINLFGVIRVTQATKHLVKQTRGRLVTVTSICGRVGLAGTGPYTVSKYGVEGYCEVIRQELRHFGVSVHVLEPGFYKTTLIAGIQTQFEEMWKVVPEKLKEEFGEEFFQQNRERMAQFLSLGSERVEEVVEAYFHALTARFPRLRYQCGNDAKFLYVPLSYLPTGLRDAIFSVADNLTVIPEGAIAKYAKIN